MLTLAGCAVDGQGLAWSQVGHGDGALVVVRQVPGVAVRSAADDFGISFGYSRITTIAALQPGAPAPGRYGPGALSSLPPPAVEIRRIIGVDVALNPNRIGVMLGVSEDALLARIPADASVVRRILLLPDRPMESSLRMCSEVKGCD